MRKKAIVGTALLLFLVFILYIKNDFNKTPPTLYYNGHIITVDRAQPVADAMLVIGGKIEAIGSLESIEHDHIKKLQMRDLEGATVMPGFIDVHTHFALSMFLSEMHDLSGFKHDTNEEVWKHFEQIAENASPGSWLIFKGLDPFLVRDLESPGMQYLDRISPDNPVVIFSQSLHNYWANSRAFDKAGITSLTSDPSPHSFYQRDTSGNFTGQIVEQEAFKPFIEIIKKEVLTPGALSAVSKKVMRNYARNGNTTIVSTGLTIDDGKPLILLEHLSGEHLSVLGGFLNKIGMLPSREPLPRHFIYLRYDALHLLPEKRSMPNDFYDIIGVKHWYDGSPYTGSMYIQEPYLDTAITSKKLAIAKGHTGKALINKSELKEFIKKHHLHGWQISIHTQGDAAIREVIDVYKELESEIDLRHSRHRLEHCILLPDTELSALKELNLYPSFHINHLFYYGESLYEEILGKERTHKILPLRSAINHGLTISLHADQPMFESRPFRLMQTAVERKTNKGRIIGADEKIDILEAITAVTINAARQINMENKIGSLEKGKYADFIILDQDPLKVSFEKLNEIRCLETFINGNKVNY